MSVSRCLGPALASLGGVARAQWSGYLDALPEVCPHADCAAKRGCRTLVSEYFRMQWRIQCAQERRLQVLAMRAGTVTL